MLKYFRNTILLFFLKAPLSTCPKNGWPTPFESAFKTGVPNLLLLFFKCLPPSKECFLATFLTSLPLQPTHACLLACCCCCAICLELHCWRCTCWSLTGHSPRSLRIFYFLEAKKRRWLAHLSCCMPWRVATLADCRLEVPPLLAASGKQPATAVEAGQLLLLAASSANSF